MDHFQDIFTFVTVACRKNEDIAKNARFEISNSQGTKNTETITDRCFS